MKFKQLCAEIADKANEPISTVSKIIKAHYEILEAEGYDTGPDGLIEDSKRSCFDAGWFSCLQILKQYRKKRTQPKPGRRGV